MTFAARSFVAKLPPKHSDATDAPSSRSQTFPTGSRAANERAAGLVSLTLRVRIAFVSHFLAYLPQLMDYGYIRDVEVESDDEEEEDDEAEGREGHNGTVDPQPGVEEADPDGEDSTQARVEGTVETETAAGSGEGEAISAPSRDARSTSSVLSTPSTARKSLGAGSQPRFAPQRMFMDEVSRG